MTSFEYRLHPVAEGLGGLVLYPLDQAADVARFYRSFCSALPDEAEAYLGFLTAPDTGTPIVGMALGYNGPISDGEKVLAPARRFGRPLSIWWRRSLTSYGSLSWTYRTHSTGFTVTGVLHLPTSCRTN